MKRYLLLLIPGFLASTLAWAGDAEPSPEIDRAQRLQRNLGLVQVLVDGGLNLAKVDDPVRRALHCSEIAKHLADEVGQAARGRDVPRVTELGRHLNALLERGIASNMSQARGSTPPGSADE